jgi:hypothetical protein
MTSLKKAGLLIPRPLLDEAAFLDDDAFGWLSIKAF